MKERYLRVPGVAQSGDDDDEGGGDCGDVEEGAHDENVEDFPKGGGEPGVLLLCEVAVVFHCDSGRVDKCYQSRVRSMMIKLRVSFG